MPGRPGHGAILRPCAGAFYLTAGAAEIKEEVLSSDQVARIGCRGYNIAPTPALADGGSRAEEAEGQSDWVAGASCRPGRAISRSAPE